MPSKVHLKKTESRLLQLDVLRGIAILLVLASHPPVSGDRGGMLTPLTRFVQFMGWTGVDLFFVLSGFLIGGLLFRELKAQQSLDLRRFYIRRCLRIWPAYYITLAAVFAILLQRTHFNLGESLRILLPNLVHVQNYVRDSNRPFGQSWTLAIEEHFYLLLPLVLVGLWKFRKASSSKITSIPWLTVTVICACITLRFIAATRPSMNIFATHLRIDSLFWGVFLAYLMIFDPQKIEVLTRKPTWTALVGLLLISPSFFLRREQWFMWTFGLTLLYCGYGLLLLAILQVRPSLGLAGKLIASWPMRLIAWVGFYSYTIYLWFEILGNKPTQALFHHVRIPDPTINWLVQFATFLAFSILSGFLAAQLVDIPVSRFRERVFPPRELTH